MSALGRTRRIASIAAIGAALAGLLSFPSLRHAVWQQLGLSSLQSLWRLTVVVLLLLNLKVLPFAWHVRLARIFIYHLHLRRGEVPQSALFDPVIVSSRTPLFECDYNGHKSNSTYFADLDMARSQLVTCILRNGINRTSQHHQRRKREGYGEDVMDWIHTANGTETIGIPGTKALPPPVYPKGSFSIALGAVSCHFRREIPPYVKYEMWTRLLTFDRKWLYLVTYFVKPGIIPKSYVFGQSRASTRQKSAWDKLSDDEKRDKWRKAVYASSIAKYVVKKGRLTIPPEISLTRSDMLPPRPANVPATFSPLPSGDSTPAFTITPGTTTPPDDVRDEDLVNGILPGPQDSEWNWEAMERERQRGMKLARLFAQLDALHDDFDGGQQHGVIGQFDSFMGF